MHATEDHMRTDGAQTAVATAVAAILGLAVQQDREVVVMVAGGSGSSTGNHHPVLLAARCSSCDRGGQVVAAYRLHGDRMVHPCLVRMVVRMVVVVRVVVVVMATAAGAAHTDADTAAGGTAVATGPT